MTVDDNANGNTFHTNHRIKHHGDESFILKSSIRLHGKMRSSTSIMKSDRAFCSANSVKFVLKAAIVTFWQFFEQTLKTISCVRAALYRPYRLTSRKSGSRNVVTNCYSLFLSFSFLALRTRQRKLRFVSKTVSFLFSYISTALCYAQQQDAAARSQLLWQNCL